MESTNNFLNWVEIKNFKSIKDLRLDCKRVNVFIGKPNVGKSNILEALGLLGAEYYDGYFMNGAVRYTNIKQLFYDNDLTNRISVGSNLDNAQLVRDEEIIENNISYFFLRDLFEMGSAKPSLSLDEIKKSVKLKYEFNSEGEYLNYSKVTVRFNRDRGSVVKKYDYDDLTTFESLFPDFLLPSNGRNLFAVVDRYNDLKNEFGKLFLEQNLELVLSKEEQAFELQKREGFYVTKYPYFSIADTFRRFMFYITAIESNKDSVIVLEEPEVHSFPPYTQELAYRMIYSTDNQFFISTHSPYLLHTFIENLEEDRLNVFVTYYENYETKVRALTTEELRHILDFSTDVFFNLDKFIPNAGRSVSA